ncbi:calmodulin-like [Hetaerina americana]|uniref:calmodulin-like n=1 Tax=Hetaerina americana TaxID=62018 RepID=UPI003A7F1948
MTRQTNLNPDGSGGGGGAGAEGGVAAAGQPPAPEAPDLSPGGEEGGAGGADKADHGPPSRRPSSTSYKVSKAQMKEFRDAFRLFDKDGDGSITQEELGRVMRSLGQFATEEELQQMLTEVDIDGDGNFSFDEFVEIVSNMGTAADKTADEEEKELRDAFRVFDKHNRGYISASDLRAVLQCLGEDLSEEEIEDMIKEVDVDGDGRIDFYEFVNALGEPGEDDEAEDEEEEKEEATPPMIST